MTETAPTDPPESFNGVLTFVDEGGSRWLAGVTLGPLIPESGSGEPVTVEVMKDRAFALIGFKIISGWLDNDEGEPT